MKQCPNCGARIDDDSRFCAECGKEITQANVCPHCGASIGEGDAFCGSCGKKIEESPQKETEQIMRVCPYCGSAIQDDDVFCQNCGRNLKDGTHTESSITNEQIYYEEEEPRKNWVHFILGAIALLAICGGGWWYYNSSKSPNTANGVAVADTVAVVDTVASSSFTNEEPVDTVAVDTSAFSNEGIADITVSQYEDDDRQMEQNSNISNSSEDSYSSLNTSSSSSRTFVNEQYVTMYLANQTFRSNDGFTIRFDGDLRMYAEGDYAGVVSVLNYNSTSAMLRYGGGQYTEGRFRVDIVGNKLQLTDPMDGSVFYQR